MPSISSHIDGHRYSHCSEAGGNANHAKAQIDSDYGRVTPTLRRFPIMPLPAVGEPPRRQIRRAFGMELCSSTGVHALRISISLAI